MNTYTFWDELEEEGEGVAENGIIRYLLTPESPVDIYLCLDLQTKNRMLILRTDLKYIYKPENFPDVRGIDINIGRTPIDPDNLGIIKITQKDSQYNDIFSALAEDLIQVVKESKSKKEGIKLFYLRLEKWIGFLEKFGSSGLSRLSARGLFGELWFLYKYLIMTDYYGSVDSWTGPKGTPQDFRLPDMAVEVKTTIMKKPQKIQIASELQLDDTGIDSLFLYHLSVIERSKDQMTLPELVDNIRNALSDNPYSKNKFNQILHLSGYLDIHKPKYANTGYVIKNETFYLVNGKFPRITDLDLPSGIGDLRYSINVSECLPFIASLNLFNEKLHAKEIYQ